MIFQPSLNDIAKSLRYSQKKRRKFLKKALLRLLSREEQITIKREKKRVEHQDQKKRCAQAIKKKLKIINELYQSFWNTCEAHGIFPE